MTPDPRHEQLHRLVAGTTPRFMQEPRELPDSAIACNCAGCTTVLAVDPKIAARCRVEPLAGRVNGRPYCKTCLPGVRDRA